jgi:hypothetical protein
MIITGTYSTVGAVETQTVSKLASNGHNLQAGLYTTRIRFARRKRVTILHGSAQFSPAPHG